MGFNQISRLLIFLGIGLVSAGLVFWLIGRFISTKNIPGTLQINVGGLTFIFPILLSVILSVVLTLVLNLISRFLQK